MKDYQLTIKTIKDSIRKSLKANDLITITTHQPNWSNIDEYIVALKIDVSDIHRKDREEKRCVTGVRFDIIFTDKFKEELCRIENVTYEPKEPLCTSDGIFTYNNVTMSYTLKYSILGDVSKSYESARKYSRENKIYTEAKIKAVVLDDGTIIN